MLRRANSLDGRPRFRVARAGVSPPDPAPRSGNASSRRSVFRPSLEGWRDGSRDAEPVIQPRRGPAGALRPEDFRERFSRSGIDCRSRRTARPGTHPLRGSRPRIAVFCLERPSVRTSERPNVRGSNVRSSDSLTFGRRTERVASLCISRLSTHANCCRSRSLSKVAPPRQEARVSAIDGVQRPPICDKFHKVGL
jgi:hypothetical protein